MPRRIGDGTNLGNQAVKALGRPLLIVDLEDKDAGRRRFAEWAKQHDVEILNVNGPRESSWPGIHAECATLFTDWFALAVTPPAMPDATSVCTSGDKATLE
mmetsp:Transcript_15493/g.54298  ORF Transcript_15493/g.54298 Transcript_15493/m.54298 type:complete len:101 (-) Transcript_15493:2-304(-)